MDDIFTEYFNLLATQAARNKLELKHWNIILIKGFYDFCIL